jgi:hypothetical protein
MPIVIRDRSKINLLSNSFVNYKVWNSSFRQSFGTAKKIAGELIALIYSEYHLSAKTPFEK